MPPKQGDVYQKAWSGNMRGRFGAEWQLTDVHVQLVPSFHVRETWSCVRPPPPQADNGHGGASPPGGQATSTGGGAGGQTLTDLQVADSGTELGNVAGAAAAAAAASSDAQEPAQAGGRSRSRSRSRSRNRRLR